MPARAGGDGDEAVGAFLDRLPCKRVVDDVVEDETAIGMDRLIDVLARAERADDDRNLVTDAAFHVLHQPVVRAMDNLVHRERRRRPVRIFRVVLRERFLDLDDPFVELFLRPRIKRGERADDSRLALRDDKLRIGNDEQRRPDHRYAHFFPDVGESRHGIISSSQWRLIAIIQRRLAVA